MIKDALSFDDVLIIPKFSKIESRKNVDLSVNFYGKLILPIISSNMDTITESEMANALHDVGAVGCLHRFMSIEKNLEEYKKAKSAWVSIGIGEEELNRAIELYKVGAEVFVLDVAHGASIKAVEQFINLKKFIPSAIIVVGNFATKESYMQFLSVAHEKTGKKVKPHAIKVGVGSGSNCTTRIVTGCGLPTLASLIDLYEYCNFNNTMVIADGGIKNSGDMAKALVYSDLVMVGSLLAGTSETPGSVINVEGYNQPMKVYRGSASLSSYNAQNKVSDWRTPEGEERLVPAKGSVVEVIKGLTAGLKSSLSYVGAENLDEFKELALFAKVSYFGKVESGAHGK